MIAVIDSQVLPLLKRCSLAGHAELKTSNTLFTEHPMAADIFVDILADRGFSAAHMREERIVPLRLDLQTGEIFNQHEEIHKFR